MILSINTTFSYQVFHSTHPESYLHLRTLKHCFLLKNKLSLIKAYDLVIWFTYHWFPRYQIINIAYTRCIFQNNSRTQFGLIYTALVHFPFHIFSKLVKIMTKTIKGSLDIKYFIAVVLIFLTEPLGCFNEDLLSFFKICMEKSTVCFTLFWFKFQTNFQNQQDAHNVPVHHMSTCFT